MADAPRIELLIGMVASGKTTYARKRAKEGALVVSHDDLTAMLHAEYRYEPGLRDCYRKMEEDLVRRALAAGRDAIVDRTHLTRESRERWTSFARWPHFDEWAEPKIVAVLFWREPAEVHATRRFESDARGRSLDEWLAVARHHEAQADAEPLDWRKERFAYQVEIGGSHGQG